LIALLERYQFDFKVGQKMQNLTGNFICQTYVGFVEKWWSKLGNMSLGWSKTAVLRVEPRWAAFPSKMLTLKCNVL
jgi:hypothetical protein